jgi:predicted phosphohydrolase
MRVGWLSDIHLNFLTDAAARQFVASLSSVGADAWVLSGDIGEADSVAGYLGLFEELVPGRTYFTLGNHDFFRGSLATVRAEVRQLVASSQHLLWLTEARPQLLDDGVAVVGDDSWGDGRFGDPQGTAVELSDFFLVEELAGLSRAKLIEAVNRLGDEAAARLAPKLDEAAVAGRGVIVVTHVPPFREAAWYQGRPSDDDWVPWFASRAVGETILRAAGAHPTVEFIVLCGHSHGSGVYSAADNVVVHTAGAQYGAPRVQQVLDTGALGSGRVA